MSASIRAEADGQLLLAGVLDFRTGPALREQGRTLIRASRAATLCLDLTAVEKSSSVGLALLLAYLRDAEAAGKTLRVRALPADMRQIAEVCELLELLPVSAA
jgi:phospholipid transport system transporter-binding protein